ncbi:MAG: right-handed parallel beta-helix repeat-containing protein [Spirochaetes bacterium]|nr:right-handed parallel beta-helix repeat-containing protein [Spirochaetota bacterium]
MKIFNAVILLISMVLIFILLNCVTNFDDEGKDTKFPWVSANPGLKENNGSVHDIPGPHAVSGTTVDVTQAPYNCNTADDNNDDRPGIEAAINAAQPGDEIYFPDGTYNLKTAWSTDSTFPKSNIRLKSSVNLRGESQAGVILKTDFDDLYTESDKDGTNSYYVIRGFLTNNVYIKNLTITAAWNRTYSTSTSVNNPQHGGPNICINLHTWSTSTVAVYNIYIENVTVEKFVNIGINAGTGCHDVVFKNCTAQNATDLAGGGCGYGFQFAGFNSGPGLTVNPNLGYPRDNYWNMMDGCTTTSQYIRHAAIIQNWSHNNLITNCSFSNTRIDSIDMHGEDEYNNEISYNNISNCPGESAIGVGNSGGTAHDKSGPHNYIHHNTIINCKYGISVQFNTPFTRIENNTISGFTASNGRGIRLGNAPYTIAKDNIIQNNNGSSYSGFYFYTDIAMGVEPAGSPTYCTITGNSVLNNSNATAFNILAGSNNTFSGNTASGNANNILP